MTRSLVTLVSAGILDFFPNLGFQVNVAWPEFQSLDGVPALWQSPDIARNFVGLVNIFQERDC